MVARGCGERDAHKRGVLSEISDYARRIGINPNKEPHLLHIALEGLMKALPEEWKPW